VRHVSEAPDDSEKRDWDLPPMEAGGPPPGRPPAPGPTTPLDRPSDDEVTDDSERRDWDLP
jgi:hypothetical protein